MPLIPGSSRGTVSKNISEFHTGKTYAHTKEKFGKERANAQAVAVALNTARKSRAMGGPSAHIGQAPWFVRQEARNITHTGPIPSMVPGRTDHHAINVASGSYVLPADHVSSLGQGNTAAGFGILGKMFGHGGPYGAGQMSIKHGTGAPHANIKMPNMKFPRMSDTGGARGEGVGTPTPINAAGGEYVIDPETVARIGGGNLKHGHAILDAWVLANRKKHVQTLKGLPGPAKS